MTASRNSSGGLHAVPMSNKERKPYTSNDARDRRVAAAAAELQAALRAFYTPKTEQS